MLLVDRLFSCPRVGDEFTFDMQQSHVFKTIQLWSGGLNGVGGPDSRDYPGALDISWSIMELFVYP
jgi:hypothetical protein